MTRGIKAAGFWLAGAAAISLVASLLFWWAPAIAAEAGSAGAMLPSGAIQWGFMAAALNSNKTHPSILQTFPARL